jgi:glycerophosphoryl diester phosphodiesterase
MRPLPRFRRALGAPAHLIAHRGHSEGPTSPDRAPRADAPLENTLPAFALAIDRGAEAVELDARVLADGTPVVFHDPDLARLTGGADDRAIASLGQGECARVELLGGARIPLLADVLGHCRARGVAVNLELKHDVPSRTRLVRAVAGLLRAWDPSHEIVLSSFDPRTLALAAALFPGLPRALVVHRSSYAAGELAVAPFLGLAAVHLERTLAAPDTVRALRRKGLLVSVWTVDDPREAADLDAIGVDSLITDDFAGVRSYHSNE